jgi:hypothetical protein
VVTVEKLEALHRNFQGELPDDFLKLPQQE